MEFTIFTILFGLICISLQWWGNRNFEKERMTGVFLGSLIASHQRIPVLYTAKRWTKIFLVRRVIMFPVMLLLIALAWIRFFHWTTWCFLAILLAQAYLTRECWIHRRLVRREITGLSGKDKESFEIYERGAQAIGL